MNSSNVLEPSVFCASRAERRRLMTENTAPRQRDAFRGGMDERDLAGGRFLILPNCALTLSCLEGELWLTRDGDIEDHVLGTGQHFTGKPGDRLVVQALRPSRLRWQEAG